jgi:hypothetical protein
MSEAAAGCLSFDRGLLRATGPFLVSRGFTRAAADRGLLRAARLLSAAVALSLNPRPWIVASPGRRKENRGHPAADQVNSWTRSTKMGA